MEEAHLNQLMINISEEVILVSDSSKFSKTGLAFICSFDKIDKLVTDDGITDEQINALKQHNVEIIIA